MEGDVALTNEAKVVLAFQSTPSVGRVTWVREADNRQPPFQSTPSVWRVTAAASASAPTVYGFQSTPSVWRVTMTPAIPSSTDRFQSTPSVWRVTLEYWPCYNSYIISIHTLRMEGDPPAIIR